MSDLDRIKCVMAAIFGVDIESIGDESSVDDLESWDSLKHINLIIALEQEFGISFPDEEVPFLTSVPILTASVRDAIGKD